MSWVKAHSGIPGNEAADRLAVNAALSQDTPAVDIPAIAPAVTKRHIREGTDKYWGYLFRNLDECRQSKMWFPEPARYRSDKILRLNRLQWGRLMQFMTGHNFLRYHNQVVFKEEADDYSCQLCGLDASVQDTEHVMAFCPYFLGQRESIFGYSILEPPFNDLPIGKVLQFLHQSGLEELAWKTTEGNN